MFFKEQIWSTLPVIPFRDEYLEPCAFPVIPCLMDGDFRDREDFPDQEEAKARIPAKTLGKDPFLILGRHTHAVIFTDDEKTVSGLTGGKHNLCHAIAMPKRVVDEVVEYFPDHGIGKDFGGAHKHIHPDTLEIQLFCSMFYHGCNRVPY